MTPRQAEAIRLVREWGPLVALLSLVFSGGVAWTRLRAQAEFTASGVSALETRMLRVEEMRSDVEAMALSLCLDQTNPIARQQLKCGQREAQAGIRR